MTLFKPSAPFAVALEFCNPKYETIKGTEKKTYPDGGVRFFGNFKTYGGSERDVNGVYSIEDTANIETWYRPDIQSDSRITVLSTGAVYELINEPENIELRNQFMKFKVRRYKGGA